MFTAIFMKDKIQIRMIPSAIKITYSIKKLQNSLKFTFTDSHEFAYVFGASQLGQNKGIYTKFKGMRILPLDSPNRVNRSIRSDLLYWE